MTDDQHPLPAPHLDRKTPGPCPVCGRSGTAPCTDRPVGYPNRPNPDSTPQANRPDTLLDDDTPTEPPC